MSEQREIERARESGVLGSENRHGRKSDGLAKLKNALSLVRKLQF
jgi:hypothetical protein